MRDYKKEYLDSVRSAYTQNAAKPTHSFFRRTSDAEARGAGRIEVNTNHPYGDGKQRPSR